MSTRSTLCMVYISVRCLFIIYCMHADDAVQCLCSYYVYIGLLRVATPSLHHHRSQNISKLQKVQNLSEHVVFNVHQSSSHILHQQLHWLHTEYKINFKIANLSINSVDLFNRRRMSLKVNRRCQWITVSGVVCRHS